MLESELKEKILKETTDLSSETLNEVLDFIKFLKSKKLKKGSKKINLKEELSELNKHSLMHLEEEFSNYKEIYPHE